MTMICTEILTYNYFRTYSVMIQPSHQLVQVWLFRKQQLVAAVESDKFISILYVYNAWQSIHSTTVFKGRVTECRANLIIIHSFCQLKW